MSAPRIMKDKKYSLTELEELAEYWREQDPVDAMEAILNKRLAWHQRMTLRGTWDTPFCLYLFGRGCSKTSFAAMYMITRALLFPNMKIGCLGPSFRQALYVFDEIIGEHWPNSPILRASCPKPPSVQTMRGMLRFHNGSYIEALPLGNDGGKARGRRYNIVFIDEYADVTEQVVNQVVQPFLNVEKPGQNNQMIIASTARYKWNHFWDQYVFYKAKSRTLEPEMNEYLENNGFKFEPENYQVFEFDFRDVNADPNTPFKISPRILENAYAKMSHDEFGMENLNVFPDETSGFFSSLLIMKTALSSIEEHQIVKSAHEDQDRETKEPYDTFYTFGIDAARSDSPTAANFCLQVIRIKGFEKNLCKSVTTKGATYQEMRDIIRRNHVDFGLDRVRGIYMDAGGGGTTLRDLLTEPWKDERTGRTYSPVVDEEDENFAHIQTPHKTLRLINQTDVFNNHMFNSLKADMESHRMKLPHTLRNSRDKELEAIGLDVGLTKTELMVLETTATKAGMKFESPRGYQKDRAVAIGLANYGSNVILYGAADEEKPDLPVGGWLS